MSRFIEVVNYRTDWLARYENEAGMLREVFGESLARLHHIGSTSVPGMKAKPIIDILVEVERGVNVNRFNPRMGELGYDCRGECLDATIPGTPGRFYFSKNVRGMRSFHVHVCHVSHWQICELLALRDYLRSNREEAVKYGELKSRLAKKFPYDNVEYMRGKDQLVKALTAAALAWGKSSPTSRPD